MKWVGVRVWALPISVAAASALAGCGSAAPSTAPPPASPVVAAHASPSPSPTTSPTGASPSATGGFPVAYAVPCAGQPRPDQVIAVLRAKSVLPSAAAVTVTTGPLCAGTWQYTVFSVGDLGPLQVVTRGAPPALELVTAGTDVCSPTVRTQAPVGIVSVARC